MSEDRICRCGVKYEYTGKREYCSVTCLNRKLWMTDKSIYLENANSSLVEIALKYDVTKASIYSRASRYREALQVRATIRSKISSGADILLIHPCELCIPSLLEKKLADAKITNLSKITSPGGLDRLIEANIGAFWIKDLTETLEDIGLEPGK